MGFLDSLIGKVDKVDATPNSNTDKTINKAYVLRVIIARENVEGLTGWKASQFKGMRNFDKIEIKGYCPNQIKLSFKNTFKTVNPFSLDSSEFVQAGFQLFTGHSSIHRVNNISVWQGSEPVSMSVKLQLFATVDKTPTNFNKANITTNTGGISPHDLVDIIQLLTSLAQPSCTEDASYLTPPGPSPLIAKFKGHVFNVDDKGNVISIARKKDNKTGDEKGLETVDQVTTTGISTEIVFGDFLRFSHVIVESVDVDIPYVMTQSGDRALPVRADITLNFRTKMMVTQQNFAKMINNRSQENPAVIDITKLGGLAGKMLNGGFAMIQDYTGTAVTKVLDSDKPKETQVNNDSNIDKSKTTTATPKQSSEKK